jgi:hypothetical protein
LFTAIRRSSTQLKISLNPNLLSIQALYVVSPIGPTVDAGVSADSP